MVWCPPLRKKRSRPILLTAEAAWRASSYSGSGSLLDITGKGHDAQLGSTSGSDANDPLFLSMVGGRPYLYLPGFSGNYANIPDAAALDVAGDIDARVALAMTDWTPAGNSIVLAKWGAAGQRSFQLLINASGALRFNASADGTAATFDRTSSSAVVASDGTLVLLRAAFTANDGSGNSSVTFYTKSSTEASAYSDLIADSGWAQLGTTQTQAGTTVVVFNSNAVLEVGSQASGTGGSTDAKFYAAALKNGIAGSLVAGIDFTDINAYNSTRTSLTAVTGQTVTINAATSGRKSVVVTANRFALGTDDYLEVADHAALNFGITDDFTVLIVIRQLATPVSGGTLIAKRNLGSATNVGWSINNATTTLAPLARISDGTNTATATATTFTAGAVVTLGMRRRAATTIGAITSGAETTAADGTTASLSNALPLRIGSQSAAVSNNQDFEFIAAAIFRRYLSDAEISRATAELQAA